VRQQTIIAQFEARAVTAAARPRTPVEEILDVEGCDALAATGERSFREPLAGAANWAVSERRA
jgi:hypothetical protein